MKETEKCGLLATFRYTWAGQDESFCCAIHGQQIQAVGQAIGYHVQLIELELREQAENNKMCQNEEPVA